MFVSESAPNNDETYEMAHKVYEKLEFDFNSRTRER